MRRLACSITARTQAFVPSSRSAVKKAYGSAIQARRTRYTRFTHDARRTTSAPPHAVQDRERRVVPKQRRARSWSDECPCRTGVFASKAGFRGRTGKSRKPCRLPAGSGAGARDRCGGSGSHVQLVERGTLWNTAPT